MLSVENEKSAGLTTHMQLPFVSVRVELTPLTAVIASTDGLLLDALAWIPPLVLFD